MREERYGMRKAFVSGAVSLAVALMFSSLAMAQTQGNMARSPWKYYPTDVPSGDGGPAPKRDLSGTWNGPGSSPGIPRGAAAEKPMLTPLAQQIMSQRKSIGRYGPAGTPCGRFSSTMEVMVPL